MSNDLNIFTQTNSNLNFCVNSYDVLYSDIKQNKNEANLLSMALGLLYLIFGSGALNGKIEEIRQKY